MSVSPASLRNEHLASPVAAGALLMKNRVVMASLTRNRSPNATPDAHVVEYYRQRASAGLILSEGILVTPQGTEWSNAPGLYTSEQIVGWRAVTDAVHAAGGLIVAQLWNVGRCQHPLLQCGHSAVSASAVRAAGGKFRQLMGEPGYQTPIAIADVAAMVALYRQAAVNAKEAGFDGVELHSANGYLGHQFLDETCNVRTDRYGGDYQKRCVFVLECVDAFVAVYGADRVGIKLSPAGGYGDVGSPLPLLLQQYSYLLSELGARGIAYVQLAHYWKNWDLNNRGTDGVEMRELGKHFTSNNSSTCALFLNGSYTGDKAEADIADGSAGGIVFGTHFIANPDLALRVINKQQLSEGNMYTFYNYPGFPESFDNRAAGYTDYPVFEKSEAATTVAA